MGSHGLLGKQSVYEHSMRCPLIFVGRDIPQGRSTNAFSYLLDVFPTLCDLVGIQRPADLTGRKRVPDQWQPEWIVRKYFGSTQ